MQWTDESIAFLRDAAAIKRHLLICGERSVGKSTLIIARGRSEAL